MHTLKAGTALHGRVLQVFFGHDPDRTLYTRMHSDVLYCIIAYCIVLYCYSILNHNVMYSTMFVMAYIVDFQNTNQLQPVV